MSRPTGFTGLIQPDGNPHRFNYSWWSLDGRRGELARDVRLIVGMHRRHQRERNLICTRTVMAYRIGALR